MAEIIDRDEPGRVEQLIDRYWFLMRGRRGGDQDDGETRVLRDGDCVVLSVEATALGWPEGMLLFRLRSESTPCAGCVDRAFAFARRQLEGPLTPHDVREMVRFAVARCAAWGPDPAHALAVSPRRTAAGGGPDSRGERAERRAGADLWLVL